MSGRMFPWPEDRWESTNAVVRETGGPQRVVTDAPDPEFVRRPIGFAPPKPRTERAEQVDDIGPDLWEGDQA